jgi:hypothetical protein
MKHNVSVEIGRMLLRLVALRSEIKELKEQKDSVLRNSESLKKLFEDLYELKDSIERYRQVSAHTHVLTERLKRSAEHRKLLSEKIFRANKHVPLQL